MTGYSATPLARKLGLDRGGREVRALLKAAPQGFEQGLAASAPGVRWLRRAAAPLDWVLWFAVRRSDLGKGLDRVVAALGPAGMLWLAWPKKSSGVATALSFDAVQRIGLDAGLVDNKICAVDETWSALRFVRRRRDRPGRQ
jgi:hypothetical protein